MPASSRNALITGLLAVVLLLVPGRSAAAGAGPRVAKARAPGKGSVRLLLVLDRSGSMHGNKIDEVRRAGVRVIRQLRQGDGIGILAFDSTPKQLHALRRVGDRRSALTAMQAITANGGTDFLRALRHALHMLTDPKAPPATRTRVIFISDGQAARSGVLAEARKLVRVGAKITTIALGPHADRKMLVDLASVGRGRFYALGNTANLVKVCLAELRRLGR